MKFIHTADLHLDSPFEGIKNDENVPDALWSKIHQAPFVSFQKIVDGAIEKDVDFVLMVGDLFDSENQSVEATGFLLKQLNRLNDCHIPVFLSFGNHDFQPDNGRQFDFPDNVYVFPDKVTTKTLKLRDGKTVAITGFSYGERWIHDDMVKDFPERGNADYHIGMIHGAVKTGNDSNYAPFTVNELENLGYDYWALGHIHKRTELSANPPVEYCGDIQGRHKNEPGPKGYLLVFDKDGKLKIQFEETSPVVWTGMNIALEQETSESHVADQILDALRDSGFQKLNLVEITLHLKDGASGDLSEDDILNRVQEKLKYEFEKINAWVYEINVELETPEQFTELDAEYWENTEPEVFSQANIKETAQKLMKNSFINDFLSDNDQLTKIKEKCKKLVTNKTGEVSDNEN